MKIKVTIEEVISQTFEVEVESMDTAYNEIKKKYDAGELTVEDATLIGAKVQIHEDEEFIDLQV